MQKILILAVEPIMTELEKKLRYRFDIESVNISPSNICEIKINSRRNWITICRFTPNESLRNVLTMFNVNCYLKLR